jgi:hypothetical protein
MNDFLQSLRNGQAEKQRAPKTRKSYDNSYHYSSGPRFHNYSGGYQNTRNQQMKRPPVAHQAGNQAPVDENLTTSMLADAIENLSVHIETLAKNQEFLINAQERAADMMERQALAIERIVSHLNIASYPPEQEDLPENDADERTFAHHYVTPRKETPVAETPVEEEAKPAKQVIRRRKKIVSKKPAAATPSGNLLSREVVMEIIHTMREEGATYDQVASHLVSLGQPTFSGRGEWHAQTIHRLCSKK